MKNKEGKEEKTCPKASEASFWTFFRGFSFSTLLATPSSFFQIRSSLSSLVLPFPLYSSLLSCTIFSPCRPGPAPGTWYEMILERFYHLPLSLSNQSHSLKLTFKYFWNYFEPILNLFWINAIFLWNDHVLIILNKYLHHFGILVYSFLNDWGIVFRLFWYHFGIVVGSFLISFLFILK